MTTGDKYKLVKEGKLYRVIALRDIDGIVRAGESGGLVQNEYNLSHKDTSWLHADGLALGDSRILGDAQVLGTVRDRAIVHGEAWVERGATVADTARMGLRAHIRRGGHLGGEAEMWGDSQLWYATVDGHAIMDGRASVCGGAHVSGGALQGDARIDGMAVIGRDVTRVIGYGTHIRGEAEILAGDDLLVMDPGWPWTITAYRTHGGGYQIVIGCQTLTLDTWDEVASQHGQELPHWQQRTLPQVKALVAAWHADNIAKK